MESSQTQQKRGKTSSNFGFTGKPNPHSRTQRSDVAHLLESTSPMTRRNWTQTRPEWVQLQSRDMSHSQRGQVGTSVRVSYPNLPRPMMFSVRFSCNVSNLRPPLPPLPTWLCGLRAEDRPKTLCSSRKHPGASSHVAHRGAKGVHEEVPRQTARVFRTFPARRKCVSHRTFVWTKLGCRHAGRHRGAGR